MRLQQIVRFESLPLDIALACCRLLHACRPSACARQGALAHCPWLETGRWPQAHKTVSSCTPGQRGDSRQHAKCRGVTGDQRAPSAPPEPAQCHKCRTCHANRRWMSPSAMQSDGGRRQAPRLPHKVPRRHRRPTGPRHAKRRLMPPRLPRKVTVDVAKRHACNAKCRGVQPSVTSATPATQRECRCRRVPRLPRKTKVDVAKCHARHTK